jgi:hypothetical protein
MSLRTPAAVLLTLFSATIASAQSLTFTPSSIPSTPGARGIASADFDGNGWADVGHANFRANTVTILLNHGGSLTKSGEIAVGNGPFDMTSADFNLDGKADLAVANADANTISLLLGSGDGRFTRTDLAVAGNPRGLTAADMNHDGRPDLVYTGFTNNRVQILAGDGSGGFAADWAIVGVAPRPQGVAAADFNKDGRLDLAVAYADGSGGLAILTRTASGGLSARLVGGERNLNVVATGDFNKDGWLDVAAASTAAGRMAVFLGGAGGVALTATYPTGGSPRDVATVDLDHDGWLDIVTANRAGDSVSAFLGRAEAPGAFTAVQFDAGDGSRAVVSADFNHDGLRDLVTGNEYEAGATLLLNHTILDRVAFGFARGTLPTAFGNSGDPLVGEFNHNGIPDLVVHDMNNAVAILDGETAVHLPAFMTVGAIADFNADGHQDLAARLWNGSSEVIGRSGVSPACRRVVHGRRHGSQRAG